MSVKIGSTVEVNIPVGGETVVLVCRQPTSEELSRLLRQRFEAKGRKVKNNLYPARAAFVDRILVDARNATYEDAAGHEQPLGAMAPLTAEDKAKWSGILGVRVESWKDLIPLSWKSSAAMQFEDPQPEGAGDDEEDEPQGN